MIKWNRHSENSPYDGKDCVEGWRFFVVMNLFFNTSKQLSIKCFEFLELCGIVGSITEYV